jgi:hypothetical protein
MASVAARLVLKCCHELTTSVWCCGQAVRTETVRDGDHTGCTTTPRQFCYANKSRITS